MMDIKRYMWTGLLGTSALVMAGCSLGDSMEEDTATEEPAAEVIAETGDILPPDSKGEGSEPKEGEDAPFAGGEVDTSIRDAGEYGNDALVDALQPAGWSQTGNIEHYNIAALYTKIDGRSELYMAYDVLGLSWVSLVDDENKDNFLDVFIYDMQSTSGSFGIYSVEREEGQDALDFGDEGYKTGSNYYVRKGRYYAYVNASRTNEANDAAGYAVAKALMERVPEDNAAIHGIDWLPKDGLIVDSVQYFKADAMSLDFLTDTFLANYNFGDAKVRVFITDRTDEAEAASIYEAFNAYGADYGDSVSTVDVDGTEVSLTDWGGDYYDGVVQIGSQIAGVSNIEGKDNAATAMKGLIERLK
ncbi:MAG: DUF6599 family protein [Candidatus Hydrogenedentota bacterium]